MLNDSSDSEEDLGLLRKALDVELPENFDPNKIPQDGFEYIQHVMYEAKNCKKLVVANIDKGKLKAQTFKIDVKEECVKAPPLMVPTLEWQEDIIADFTKLRKFISHKRVGEPTNTDTTHHYKMITSVKPKFSDILALTEGAKLKLLELVLDQLNCVQPGAEIGDELGIWIYSILATLEIPLIPEICHCLRELARKCSVIRSRLPQDCDEHVYNPCNLFICVIARYFKQLDLADNENDL